MARCWVLRERMLSSVAIGPRGSSELRGLAAVRTRSFTGPPGFPGLAVRAGSGVVRSLRTAQWTRASLWPSY